MHWETSWCVPANELDKLFSSGCFRSSIRFDQVCKSICFKPTSFPIYCPGWFLRHYTGDGYLDFLQCYIRVDSFYSQQSTLNSACIFLKLFFVATWWICLPNLWSFWMGKKVRRNNPFLFVWQTMDMSSLNGQFLKRNLILKAWILHEMAISSDRNIPFSWQSGRSFETIAFDCKLYPPTIPPLYPKHCHWSCPYAYCCITRY